MDKSLTYDLIWVLPAWKIESVSQIQPYIESVVFIFELMSLCKTWIDPYVSKSRVNWDPKFGWKLV